MKLLKNFTSKPLIFQRTFGLSLQQFNILIVRMDTIWLESEFKRKTRIDRQRKIGGGRHYTCTTMQERLLIVLLYYKAYLTQEFIGIMFDLDQANVSRLLQKMLPLIEQIADPELSTYLAKTKAEHDAKPAHNRINNWLEFTQQHPDLQDVSTDATEQPCYRSQNYETQKKYYSGKAKQHSLKTQISVASTGRILDVSNMYPGSVHDKAVTDKEGTIHKFPAQTCHRMDAGYQGVIKENPDHYLVTPHKKPKGNELTPLAKELNRANSRRRVVVEHALSRIKKFRICDRIYRGNLADHNQVFRNVVALVNFKLAAPLI